MARLREDAQWIVLMGFIVSFSLFFIAVALNQSTVVGQTTAESVLEFPKNDIRSMKVVVLQSVNLDDETLYHNKSRVQCEITNLSLSRKNSVVSVDELATSPLTVGIHYNNGVTIYNENWTKI